MSLACAEIISYVRESEWKTNKKNKTFSNLNSRHVVLMNKIKKFYCDKNNLNILMSIIEGESFLSLRVIDFFVTNYAREKEIIYENINENEADVETENEGSETSVVGLNKIHTPEKFMVYYSYKSQLKAYSKKQFDPFCRRERILFFIDKYDGVNNEPIRTTVGQLNFFRWAIKNNILDYIYNNYENIENEMNKFSKKGKTKIIKKIKKKVKNIDNSETCNILQEDNLTLNDLTLSATKKVNKHNITITVKFN
jgi:hypothetical protein